MILSLVAAVAENGVIGRGGGLPWRLPDDVRHFKRLTTGHAVIMGRKTYDEIRTPLKGRRNIVITRNPDFRAEGVEPARGLDDALRLVAGDEEAFVVGGAEIYAQALPFADRMYLTEVHARVKGDTRFPAWNPGDWRVVSSEPHQADERHPFPFTIRRYERRRAEDDPGAGLPGAEEAAGPEADLKP